MREYLPLPSMENIKQQAKRLRAQIAGDATPISHSQSLELIAHQYGYKDWNTLHAAVGNQPPAPPFALGNRVTGLYLGNRFEGEIIAITAHGHSDRYRVTINFDEPVDVIKFEGWSAYRKRVSSNITPEGRSVEKTSDGLPLMQIEL